MEESIFKELVDKYFSSVVGKVVETENGATTPPTLLHKTMLVNEYSADLNWGASTLNNSVVAADIVSMDSSLPLKQRSTLRVATGKLPKVGLKYRKSESEISDINVMKARGTNEATVASKLLDDAVRAIKAIDVRNEIMFLQGLSTGYALVTEEANQGTAIRASFGYKDENKLKAKKAWSVAGATPLSDISAVFDKAQADGNPIAHVYIDTKTFNELRASNDGKVLGASYSGHVVTGTDLLPVPPRSAFLEALKDEYNAEWHVIDSKYRVEGLDGTKKPANAWAEGNIVFTTTDKVGRLVYGTLVEETNPVAGVVYEKAGDYTLISKYSTNDPVEEYTAGQALCLPVIDGADSIYLLTQK